MKRIFLVFLCLAAAASPVLRADTAAAAADRTSLADRLLGIPYRPDGVRDESGRYSLFAHPEQTFDTPGLNCSGLDYTLLRMLSPLTLSTRQAARDRLGDSGPGAPLGQDWDFGFNLILNLSDSLPRRWLLPEPGTVSGRESGLATRGFPVADLSAWKRALEQMGPDDVLLASFSQAGRSKGYTLQHYHVAVVLPDASGGRWLYQALPRSGVTKTDLADPAGMRRILASFAGAGDRRVLLLAVTLPPGR
jgi:hypothetical protein